MQTNYKLENILSSRAAGLSQVELPSQSSHPKV